MPTIKTTDVGTCYRDTYQLMFDNTDAVLVHGYPRCTDDAHRGKKMGHAWIEVFRLGQTWVIDAAHPDKLIHERIYYHVGQIDPAECKRYTLRRAAQLATRSGHYGPWGQQPADVHFAERDDG